MYTPYAPSYTVSAPSKTPLKTQLKARLLLLLWLLQLMVAFQLLLLGQNKLRFGDRVVHLRYVQVPAPVPVRIHE